MTDTGTGAGSGTGDGAAKATDKSAWTSEQWEAHLQRETDRRVTDAHKKWSADLTAQLTAKDQDAQQKIDVAIGKAKQAEARAAFAERAIKEGVADVTAAYAVAKECGYLTDAGADFEKMKGAHPSLFGTGKQTPAGAAPDIGVKEKITMTSLLRKEMKGN